MTFLSPSYLRAAQQRLQLEPLPLEAAEKPGTKE